jgi:cytoskeletal protein RodZ
MNFFPNHSPSTPPLGEILRKARHETALSLEQAALRACLIPKDARHLEEGDFTKVSSSRLKAVSYARSLGLNPSDLKNSLPDMPALVSKESKFLSVKAAQHQPFLMVLSQLFGFLAPMGRAVLYLLIATTLLGTWGVVRQLARVRYLPWTTIANNTTHNIPQP